ncbi:MAG TPA: deoxyribonuclease IV [Thermoanaerobaculia bacterium]|jgi:deoxyribonuclease-4|nr:deoxyribonuclease IV [Thermoanaerobaculia bacterium]
MSAAPRREARAAETETSRFLGAHVSVAGGLPRAFERGRALGCTAMQVFVKNASRWQGKVLEEEEVASFREGHAHWTGEHGGAPLVAHAAYLINLAAGDPVIRARSRAGLADELERCGRLGVGGLVVHPGAHGGAGPAKGIRRVAASLDAVLKQRPRGGPRVLLETTAGQGTCLGWRLEQLEAIIAKSRYPAELAVCLDTCHLHAAGYAVDTPEGIDAVLAEACARFGRERIACVHLNDSKYPRGARRDRHANLGEGTIGRDAFAHLLRAPELALVPLIVETPDDDEQGHARDLAFLRSQ